MGISIFGNYRNLNPWESYFLETLCHEDENNESDELYAETYHTYLFNDKREQKMHMFPGYNHVRPATGVLQSVVHTSVNINNLNPQNMATNTKEEAEFNKGAILAYQRFFNKGFDQSSDNENLEIMNYVNLTMTPSVFMEYRTLKQMEQFEKPNKRNLDKTIRREWNRRTIYDKVEETVVITCHVQGAGVTDWKLEWLHDGVVVNEDYPNVKMETTSVRKINNYRSRQEREDSDKFCSDHYTEDGEKEKCKSEQRMFSFLPSAAVEVLPNCKKPSCAIELFYETLEAMYRRMDIRVNAGAARGSWQCRVTSPDQNVIRTLIFFDDSDIEYTPASISLTQYEPDPTVKMSTVNKGIGPVQLSCVLDGLEAADLERFEMSSNQAREHGDMTARKGRYPELIWHRDSERFWPGLGNRIFGGTNEYDPYLYDTFGGHGHWNDNDMTYISSEQNVFYTTRKSPSSRIQLRTTLKIYNWIESDAGQYKCGIDHANSTVDVKPFAAPQDNLYPVEILSATPLIDESNKRFGVALKWSTPYDPCRNEQNCYDGECTTDAKEKCNNFRKKYCDSTERDEECDSGIREKFGGDTNFRFELGLFPLDETVKSYLTLDHDHKTVSRKDIRLGPDFNYVTVDNSAELESYLPPCAAKILCAIDEKYSWGKCGDLESGNDKHECIRYQNVGMTRLICGCSYWNSIDDKTISLLAGIKYDIRMIAKEMKPMTTDGSSYEGAYVLRKSMHVTMPVLPIQINQKPIINIEQSSSIFDGYVMIHWSYSFDDPSAEPVNGIKPIIQNHYINWGYVNQDPYLSRSLDSLTRSARIGPLSPNKKYFVYIDVSYKGAPNNVEKSLNYYIEGNRVYDYIKNPEERRRPLGVRDFSIKAGLVESEPSYKSIIYNFKSPLIDRNQYFELRTYHPNNIEWVINLNPGKIKSIKKCVHRCEYKYSRLQQFIAPLSEAQNQSFSARMTVYDFRNVDSLPKYAVYISENELSQYGKILPPCQLLYNNSGKDGVLNENDELKLEWTCEQRIRLQIGQNKTYGTRKQRMADDAFVTFIQQLERAKLTHRLQFELRWIFRTELFQDDIEWKADRHLVKTYDELRKENEREYIETADKNISEPVLRKIFAKEYGTSNIPFTIPWINPQSDNVNKCDRTFAQIRMFLVNPADQTLQLSSNFSDLLSFDAPDQRPMSQPVIETLMYNAKRKYLKLVPETSIDRTCDQTSYVQVHVRKGLDEDVKWSGCIKITSDTLENQEQLILHHMTHGTLDNRKNITLEKIFVFHERKDCDSFDFRVRIGSAKPNKKPDPGTDCPEFDDRDDKMSQWTDWNAIVYTAQKEDHQFQETCKKPEPPLPPEPTVSPNETNTPTAEPSELEIECLFPKSKLCLKIVHLIGIIGALVIILVLTCISFCCIFNKNRRQNRSGASYTRTDYVPMNKKNNQGLYGGTNQNCSRGEETGLIGMDIQHSLPTFNSQQNAINNRTITFEPDSPPRRSTSSEFIKPRPILPRLQFGTTVPPLNPSRNPTLSEPTPQQQEIYEQRNKQKENLNQPLPIETQFKFSFNSKSSPPNLPLKTTTPRTQFDLKANENEIHECQDSDSFPSSTISLSSDFSPPAKHRNISMNENMETIAQ